MALAGHGKILTRNQIIQILIVISGEEGGASSRTCNSIVNASSMISRQSAPVRLPCVVRTAETGNSARCCWVAESNSDAVLISCVFMVTAPFCVTMHAQVRGDCQSTKGALQQSCTSQLLTIPLNMGESSHNQQREQGGSLHRMGLGKC
jgi:hypothetical protein